MTIDVSFIVAVVMALAGGSGIAGIIIAISAKKKSRADTVKVIEEATTTLIAHYKEDNEAIRLECRGLRQEVEELTCRLDNDVEECKREINGLQEEVKTLKEKNQRLMIAVERLVYQIKSKGDVPVVRPEDFWAE
jgi:predicted RNase H-like nuclease (RuvC/YqgF family)